MIFRRSAGAGIPAYGFMLLFGTNASGFSMNLSSVDSVQVIPDWARLCE